MSAGKYPQRANTKADKGHDVGWGAQRCIYTKGTLHWDPTTSGVVIFLLASAENPHIPRHNLTQRPKQPVAIHYVLVVANFLV